MGKRLIGIIILLFISLSVFGFYLSREPSAWEIPRCYAQKETVFRCINEHVYSGNVSGDCIIQNNSLANCYAEINN